VGSKAKPSHCINEQAIANMWNAPARIALILMSEPALALPYEKRSAKFLTQAKNAERILCQKRLGFEPPPVSESRRLSGANLTTSKNAKQSTINVNTLHSSSAEVTASTPLQLWLNAQSNEVMLKGLILKQYNP